MRRVFLVLAVIGLVGCGGGGAGQSPGALDTGVAPVPTPDAASIDAPPAAVDVAQPEAVAPMADAGADVVLLEPTDGFVETDALPLAPIVRPGVRVLPDDGSMTIVAVTGDTVTLRGAVPVMEAGNVLVSGRGEGFARRVTSIAQSGADTIIATQPAALTDIFEQGELVVDRVFGPDDMSMAMTIPGTVSGETVLPFLIQPQGIAWFTLPFDHLFLDHPSGKVRLHGSAGLGLGLNVKAEMKNFALSKLRVVPSVHGQVRATFVSQVTARSNNHRLPMG